MKFKKETEKTKVVLFRLQNRILSLVEFYLPDFVCRYLTSKKQELHSCLLLASLDFNNFSQYELFKSWGFFNVSGVGVVFWKEDPLPRKLLLGPQEMSVHVLALRFPLSPQTNHVCDWVTPVMPSEICLVPICIVRKF